jgi:hypothetical protein
MAIRRESTSKVNFTGVQVRHYPRAINDNPSVTDGPPIGIDWDYDTVSNYSVDEWENSRMGNRRSYALMLVSRDERHAMLVDAGFSEKEIAGSIRNVLKVKFKRRQTVNNLKASPMEEFMENTSRKVKSVFRPCSKVNMNDAVYPIA